MKKIYIAIAVLAAAVLASCQREQSFDDHVFGENEVAFTFTRGATRAAEVGSPVTKGVSMKLGRVGNNNLFIEETITDLNVVFPGTRGVPVYTENVGYLEGYDLSVNVPSQGDAIYDKLDDSVYDDGVDNNIDGWRYSHIYSSSIWPSDGSKVDFYFRMPANMTSNGVTLGTSAYSDGKTTFSYTSPTTAEGQKDIIFSHVKINKQEHKDALPGGYPVTFYHALTGIKFAIANELTERTKYGIKVTGLSFVGLKSTGDCVVNVHAAGTETDPFVKWSNLGGATDNAMTQAFAYADGDSNDKYVKTYTQPAEGAEDPNHFGSTFYGGGLSQNLNDDSASYTFWVIPQNVASNENAKLRINYEMNGVEEYMDVPLSVIAKKAWDPGQLRTFTFRLDDVNVKIEDNVTLANQDSTEEPYKGSYKDGINIENTSNTDVFVRAALVGQWLDARDHSSDSDGGVAASKTIIFGFRDEINNLYLVESWYQDQFSASGQHTHGEFIGLAGYKDSATDDYHNDGNPTFNDWTLCEDGYYYYNKVVYAKEDLTANPPQKKTTTELFHKYIVGVAPLPIDPVNLQELDRTSVYFTLEIATQAISARDPSKLDGSNFTDWKDAWKNADVNKNAPVPVQ